MDICAREKHSIPYPEFCLDTRCQDQTEVEKPNVTAGTFLPFKCGHVALWDQALTLPLEKKSWHSSDAHCGPNYFMVLRGDYSRNTKPT